MRFGRSVARNCIRAGVRQRLVAARRLVVGSACQSTGESWRSLGHTVGRVTVTGDGCRFGRTVCLPAAALFSLRLGEPCDRGRRQRLTAHCPVKKKHGIIIVIPIAAAGTDEIPIAAAGGETWTETELWWSFLCNNVLFACNQGDDADYDHDYETRDQRPETRDRRPETRDPRLETRD